MALVAGVDGCPGGWLCVTFDTGIGFRDVIIYSSVVDLESGLLILIMVVAKCSIHDAAAAD